MNNYRSTSLKIGSLFLDHKNTRIPTDRRSDKQRSLLHVLLEHEDVKSLAASIAKLGLFPNERLVVLPDGKRFIVLEGNRRLAAMKLLLNPELAPTNSLVKYFRKLSATTDLAALAKIDVAIVKSRVAAGPIIAALHIGDAKRRWSSLQQARYCQELIDEGLTPFEVADNMNVTLGQVRSFLRSEKLYRVALTLDHEEHVRTKLEDSKFPLTTLDRFIDSKIARKFIGIELDDKHGFKGIVHVDRFKAVLTHVTKDIATQKGLTRQINDEKGFEKYIREANNIIPKTKIRGSFSAISLLGENEDEETLIDKKKTATGATKPKRTSSSVVPIGFNCSSKNDKVKAVFSEIKLMKIEQHRNSTGVILRVLIDTALWYFLEKEGHIKSACNHFDKTGKKRNNNPDWTPPLRDLISYSVEKRLFPGMAASGYKSVRTLASKDSNYFITVDGFNAFTHSPYVTPTEGDLRALWQRAEPMLEIILNK